ncbi:hypothetical protein [endosymbiont of unidentified scaly snail isolate Monju]|uniref:hypothetical protein n=1 Tax=endosymbiont of unidentified scaly snail isolate Monju TaxID=1248727 RepID=UPI00038929FE|nr:hypothetical protein [endosymbiont of unidentified scaly snail isolate Monju]BAN69157.1 conserved hypothetical protein [endosymbiont of unidentified scaly snail isolate Monju]
MKEPAIDTRTRGVIWLTLFSTTGTLLCCALPILLVTLGLGGAVVALTGDFPFLIPLTQHKAWIFTLSGLMLLVSGCLLYRPGQECPTDPVLGTACSRAMRWNRRIHGVSVAIWGVGFVAAYLALPLRIWLEGRP